MIRRTKLITAGALLAVVGIGGAIAQGHAPMGSGFGPMGGHMMERLCAPEGAPNGEHIVDRIAGRLRVTDAQRPALTGLQEAIAKAFSDAKVLCAAKPDLTTPAGKLTAAEKRMEAILAGMKTVHPKLDAFYAVLDEAQKAKFNSMGPGEHHGWGERMRGWMGHGPGDARGLDHG